MAHIRKADVLVVDAEPVARTGLIHLINSHARLRVCGEAETLARAQELCARHQPEVLVLDVAIGDAFSFMKDLPRCSATSRPVRADL